MILQFHPEVLGRYLGPPIFAKLIKKLRVKASPPYEIKCRKSHCKTAGLIGAVEMFP